MRKKQGAVVGEMPGTGAVDVGQDAPGLAARADEAELAPAALQVTIVEDPVPPSPSARYRVRRAAARRRALKVLYGEDEFAVVVAAAARAGLRPSSFVAAVALADAQGVASPAGHGQARELLAELMQSRTAVRRYGTNLNQIAAAMNAGLTEPPMWLAAAVAGADRATTRIDAAAGQLSRRLA